MIFDTPSIIHHPSSIITLKSKEATDAVHNMSPTKKRRLEDSEPTNYEELAEKYKEKLILLARAYAKLINTTESYAAFQQSSSNKTLNKGINIDNSIEEEENGVVEDKEDQLLCCSQLEEYNDSQEEEEESPSDFLMPSFRIGRNSKSDLSIDEYDNGDDLIRHESTTSQKSNFFTAFIENCGNDLGEIPELDYLINLGSIHTLSQPLIQHENADDASETDTILVTNQSQFPSHARVNVVVLVKDPTNPLKILTTIKKDAHGGDTLVLPCGYLEMGESFEKCASREVKENIGIPIHNIKYVYTTNDIFNSNKHHVTIFMSAECDAIKSLESANIDWESYSWQQIDEIASGTKQQLKLYAPLLNFVQTKPSSASQLFLTSVSPCK